MFGIVKTIHPPTIVDTSCSCRFFSADEENLVTGGATSLHVYRVIEEEPELPTEAVKIKKKLECIASFSLFGNIVSISSIRLPWRARDILLLSFKEAKLSVVEYDSHTHDLQTLSLHYFEEDDLKSGLYNNYRKPVVRVDPDLRCVAMLVYGCQLVVFPFKKDLAMADDGLSSKSPFSASYIIELSKMEEKIHNVIDIQFMHGYYEPTLFILHEPIRTWTGRMPARHDTCCIDALSLNMQEKVHPTIWSMESLPFDCLQALAVPKPIGGVLILAATSIIYMNQSHPPYAASLMSVTDKCSAFPMKIQEGVAITLDNSHACFISSNQVVITTKTGEIYVLTLILDGMKAVNGFHFDKTASSVLPSTICVCGKGVLFLGSRLGNSLLLKYTEKDSQNQALPLSVSSQPVKRKKLDSNDWMATSVTELENDIDELEVYGTSDEAQTGVEDIKKYVFQVCDSLVNIGPCGNICLGEPAFLSEELTDQLDHDLELVTTSGHGKNGALSVLQRSIRPQIVTTFQLPDVVDMWTVKGPLNSNVQAENDADKPDELNEGMHAYLILSKKDSTMILRTSDDIMELDNSGFSTETSTIFAGNVGELNYIVQVTPQGIRLLRGVDQLQTISLDLDSPIITASIVDSYLIIVSEEGAMVLLQFKVMEDGDARLTVLKQSDDMDCSASTVCLYKDMSGLFSCESKQVATVSLSADQSAAAPAEVPVTRHSISEEPVADEEDELLYGDTEMLPSLTTLSTLDAEKETAEEKPIDQVPEVSAQTRKEPTFWAVLVTKANDLEIYSLPDFKLVYSVKNFSVGYRVLHDCTSSHPIKESENILKTLPMSVPVISELLITSLGASKRPFIFARSCDDVLVYEAFRYNDAFTTERLQLRFKRFNHGLILRERRGRGKRKMQEESLLANQYAKQLLKHFDNIGGYAGVFIAGPYPHWFIMSKGGKLRTHPMGIDGRITSISTFNNVNCPHGFLYFNKQGDLRISVLPTHLSYENNWPLRKIPLKCTTHFVTYHPESKTYLVVASHQQPCKRYVRIESDEKKSIEADHDERFVYTTENRFYVQLFSPINFEPIPGTKVEMDDFEAITSLEILLLKSEGRASGLQDYVGLATNSSFNEEVTSKGRLLLFEVIDVVPEPGQPLTKNKLKEIYAKEQKGPVTALNHVDGMLIAAIGQKIYVYQLKDNDLVGVSFIDSQVYIHQMHTVKNMILIADIQKSISVMRYQSEYRVLSTVSRDVKPMEVFSTEFFVDNTTLGFIACDREQNLSIFMYQPEAVQSQGGAVLLKKADFNVGTNVSSMCRVRCKLSDPSTDKKHSGIIEKRHVTYFASSNGSIGYVLPLAERVYRRLGMTQSLLYSSMPHTAGLNPKTFRSIRQPYRMLQNAQHNLIDGDLVWKFLNLTANEKIAMTKRIGTTPDQIVEDLLEIDRMTAHF